MKALLTVIFVLAMAIPVMALDCPEDSLNVFYEDGQNYGFSYSCDDGLKTRVIVAEQATTNEKLVEIILQKKCITFRELIICR